MVKILGGDPFVQKSLELCFKYKGIVDLLRSDIPIKIRINKVGTASAAQWGKTTSKWSIGKTNPWRAIE